MLVFVSQSKVYYKIDRLLTDLTAQQSSTTAQRDSNKKTLTKKNYIKLKLQDK